MTTEMESKILISSIKEIIPADRIITNGNNLKVYSHDESDIRPVIPLCAIRPVSSKEIQDIVGIARSLRIPITPRGGGTSLEGSSIPTNGAIVLDLSLMNKVIECVPEERRIKVEPGVIFSNLNRFVAQYGLFFPPTPGGSQHSATIGGMVSTDASGIYAIKYGGTRPWVLGLEVVIGTKEILRLGSICPKTSSGIDLKNLFIGAEGTLGVVTEIDLRLAPLPEKRAQICALFHKLDEALEAAINIAGYVPDVAMIELVENDTLKILSSFVQIDCFNGNGVFIEVHGTKDQCREGINTCKEIISQVNGVIVEGFNAFSIRDKATDVVRERSKSVVRTDCAVPLLKLAGFIMDAKKRAEDLKKDIYIFGHVGLGILHILLPLGGAHPWTMEEALKEKERLGLEAVKLNGAISGEHGIGLGFRNLFSSLDPTLVRVMREVKKVFDPANIMNPDKILIPLSNMDIL